MTSFGILGPLEITRDGLPLPGGGSKLRTLLAALLVHGNETVPADRLTDILWPIAPPANAANALQSQVTRLRHLVDDAHSPTTAGATATSRIERQGAGYRLIVGPHELDASRFDRHRRDCAAAIAAGNWHAAVEHAETALSCWRGPALEGFGDQGFARATASQLEEHRLATVEHRIEAKLALGQHRQLVADLWELVDRYPLRETLWIHLIVALYRSDRQSEALRAYTRIRGILAEELGILPCPELARLERLVLDQDSELDLSSPRDEVGTPPATVPAEAEAAPPQQLPTFLFTGIDHPGTLWDRDPVATGARQRRAEALVRTAIDTHGGMIFGQPTDGFCAAFRRPTDAISAAVDAQRQLRCDTILRDGSPGDGSTRGAPDCDVDNEVDLPRVRMAVHTGEAEFVDGFYYGAAVNLVARMRDAGHGGQVLISAAAHELLRDQDLGDIEMLDAGSWSFDGVGKVERVYELRHPQLTTGFPPLRSGRRHSGTLPRNATSFLGREEETQQVLAALEAAPVVSVTGEGGIGKTRLALEVARRVGPSRYPDGVWFCDLSAVDEAAGLAGHVASTLQPGRGTSGPGDRDLLEGLRGAHLLLVLDNCERLRVPVGELVGTILASDAQASLLITSRAPLRVRGEHVIRLDHLGLPAQGTNPASSPALQLLVDRATAAGAQVDEADPALSDIVRVVDGLPLAIELAAPRLATLAPRDLANRLARSTELLTAAADVPARQRSLRATVDSSFQLLGEPVRRLFGALAVFRDGWTLTAAEAVATGAGVHPDTVATLIADLADHSMVRVHLAREGTARYGMLDAMRTYAEEYLAATGHGAAVADDHARHFIELAETAATFRRTSLEPAWVEALSGEFPNLRAAYRRSLDAGRPEDALRLVAALADDVLMREWLEAGRWAEELAAQPGLEHHPLHPTTLALAGNTAMVEGRLDDALRLSDRALSAARAREHPPPWIAHNTLALLTAAGLTDHRWSEHLDAMDVISNRTGDPLPAAVADYDRVLVASLAGTPAVARPAAEALLGRPSTRDNPSLLAMGLFCHGRTVATDDPDLAVRRFREALTTAASARNILLVQQALRAIEEIEAGRAGDPAAALATLHTIARQFEESGNIGEQLHTLTTMLEPLAACRAFDAVATICGALADTPWRHTATWHLADRRAAEQLSAERHRAARQAGAAMAPAAAVAFASRFVEGLGAGAVGTPAGGGEPA